MSFLWSGNVVIQSHSGGKSEDDYINSLTWTGRQAVWASRWFFFLKNWCFLPIFFCSWDTSLFPSKPPLLSFKHVSQLSATVTKYLGKQLQRGTLTLVSVFSMYGWPITLGLLWGRASWWQGSVEEEASHPVVARKQKGTETARGIGEGWGQNKPFEDTPPVI
jgi:hypothetical protein